MTSLDDLDAELLETEETIRRLEEQLQGLRQPDLPETATGPKGKATPRVPGRWCRAGYVPKRPPGGKALQGPSKSSSKAPTFGSAERFGARQEAEGDFLLNPADHFLSTTAVVKGAKMHRDTVKPRQLWEAKKWLETVAEQSKCQEASEILKADASLSAVTAAWQALLADEQRCDDEVSTDAGSELPELLSVSSAASSFSLPPGPGSYSPNYEVLRPSLAKGAPSFARYSAREKPRDAAEEDAETSTSTEISTPCLLRSEDEQPGFTCRGGKILPPHNTRPRRPTASQQDAMCYASRPLGVDPVADVKEGLVLQTTEAEDAAPPWSLPPATGRLERLAKAEAVGPGDYELPELPGGPAPIIAPPAEVKPEVRPSAPGPAQYDLRASQAHVYPRAVGGHFAEPRPEVMEHQRAPDYVAKYEALEVNFQAVEPRAPAALILPEESEEALRALELMKHRAPAAGTGPRVGPGSYQEEDAILQRIRPDRKVLPWRPLGEGVVEHLLGLHQRYTRFGRWRLDDRALLGVDDDLALRRNRPRAFIQPPHQPPLKRSWSAEDIWRLYLPKLDEPRSRNFARNLDFDEWQEKEKHWRWLAVRHFCRTRPSLRLSYSLPDLELLKERAPEVDFAKAAGRSPRAMEEEEVEGDVLLLDLGACDALRFPQPPQPVAMARQLGRDTGDGTVDDFEELVLSPKRPGSKSRCLVDMAKEPGRPGEPAWDPHIWAEEPDRVFCYQPTTAFETEDVLDLSPAAAQRRLQRRVPTYDWARCMGRPGHDLRHAQEEEGPVLLTNWQPPFVAPPIPTLAGGADAIEQPSLEVPPPPAPPGEPPSEPEPSAVVSSTADPAMVTG